jgi:hypothetical protein
MKYQMEEIIQIVKQAQAMDAKRKADQDDLLTQDMPYDEYRQKRTELAYGALGGYEFFIRQIGIFARLAMEENPS